MSPILLTILAITVRSLSGTVSGLSARALTSACARAFVYGGRHRYRQG